LLSVVPYTSPVILRLFCLSDDVLSSLEVRNNGLRENYDTQQADILHSWPHMTYHHLRQITNTEYKLAKLEGNTISNNRHMHKL